MSKMTKPRVDVVRFNESDVIVASGGVTPLSPPLYIRGFSNTYGGSDGSMGWGGHTYFYSDHDDLVSKLREDGYGVQVQRNPSGTVNNIDTMFEINHSDNWSKVETTTGDYYWNPSAGRWEYNYNGQ